MVGKKARPPPSSWARGRDRQHRQARKHRGQQERAQRGCSCRWVEAWASATGKCRVAQRAFPKFGAGEAEKGNAVRIGGAAQGVTIGEVKNVEVSFIFISNVASSTLLKAERQVRPALSIRLRWSVILMFHKASFVFACSVHRALSSRHAKI